MHAVPRPFRSPARRPRLFAHAIPCLLLAGALTGGLVRALNLPDAATTSSQASQNELASAGEP